METRRRNSRNFLTIIVRSKNEPFVSEFVEHYLSEGVDEIYIFDNGSDFDYADSVKDNERVIILEDNILFAMHPTVMESVLVRAHDLSTEWLLYVDMDEFITSRRQPDKTIRQELQTTFRNADCVKVPWVMMSANGRLQNPDSLLMETTHRWDHDKRHENHLSTHPKFRCRYDKIEVKSIFRPEKFEFLSDHNPYGTNGDIVCVDSTDNRTCPLDPFHRDLREADISRAFLACYHYRTYSVESAYEKMQSSVFYSAYTLEDIMSTDYPELVDETLARKARARKA